MKTLTKSFALFICLVFLIGTVSSSVLKDVEATNTPGPLAFLILNSNDADSICFAGDAITYTALGYDQNNNLIDDFTTLAIWSIDPLAGGSWAGNIYTSEKKGDWNITATYVSDGKDITKTKSLHVNAASLDSLQISPAGLEILSGESVPFSAEGFDKYLNSLGDYTGLVNWGIDEGTHGTWDGCTYNSAYTGDFTVTATYSLGGEPVIGTTTLGVRPSGDPVLTSIAIADGAGVGHFRRPNNLCTVWH